MCRRTGSGTPMRPMRLTAARRSTWCVTDSVTRTYPRPRGTPTHARTNIRRSFWPCDLRPPLIIYRDANPTGREAPIRVYSSLLLASRTKTPTELDSWNTYSKYLDNGAEPKYSENNRSKCVFFRLIIWYICARREDPTGNRGFAKRIGEESRLDVSCGRATGNTGGLRGA
jgi:hypothetical protein